MENFQRVEGGMAQLGMVQVELMYAGWRGEKPFDKPMRNWRLIAVVTPVLANHVVALAKKNMKPAFNRLKRALDQAGVRRDGAMAGAR